MMGDTLVAALDDVSLDVRPGDFLMIVGSSGSGKSTLMHLLGLLDVPTDGLMSINDASISECSEAQLSWSTRQIKAALRDIVDAEDTSRPLSDDDIKAALAERGFPIARRTVAKYREKLGIPIARLRKK